MAWAESKSKFNEDGSPKTYLSHKTVDGKLCFGRPMKASEQPSQPVSEYTREPSFTHLNGADKAALDKPDWDAIAEGKVRSLFIQAHIQKNGLVALTAQEDAVLDGLVERAMGDSRK